VSGRLERDGFEAMIREQLKHYGQRHTARAMQGAAASGSSIGHVLFTLKHMSATLDDLSQRVDVIDDSQPHPAHADPATPLTRRTSNLASRRGTNLPSINLSVIEEVSLPPTASNDPPHSLMYR
jgi:hypothetical protein